MATCFCKPVSERLVLRILLRILDSNPTQNFGQESYSNFSTGFLLQIFYRNPSPNFREEYYSNFSTGILLQIFYRNPSPNFRQNTTQIFRQESYSNFSTGINHTPNFLLERFSEFWTGILLRIFDRHPTNLTNCCPTMLFTWADITTVIHMMEGKKFADICSPMTLLFLKIYEYK
jgi:hypothetical protein